MDDTKDYAIDTKMFGFIIKCRLLNTTTNKVKTINIELRKSHIVDGDILNWADHRHTFLLKALVAINEWNRVATINSGELFYHYYLEYIT